MLNILKSKKNHTCYLQSFWGHISISLGKQNSRDKLLTLSHLFTVWNLKNIC